VKVLSQTHSLRVLLQDPKRDLSHGVRSIERVIASLENMKISAEESFSTAFGQAEVIAKQIGITSTAPRTCSRQAHRNDAYVSSAEEYYRQAIFISHLDHFVTDLKTRFGGVLKDVFALQGLIPQ